MTDQCQVPEGMRWCGKCATLYDTGAPACPGCGLATADQLPRLRSGEDPRTGGWIMVACPQCGAWHPVIRGCHHCGMSAARWHELQAQPASGPAPAGRPAGDWQPWLSAWHPWASDRATHYRDGRPPGTTDARIDSGLIDGWPPVAHLPPEVARQVELEDYLAQVEASIRWELRAHYWHRLLMAHHWGKVGAT